MKTLRAFLLGSALGALVGLILAPQRDTIAQAQLEEERSQGQRAGASGSQAMPQTQTQTQPAAEAPTTSAATSSGSNGSSERRYVGNLNTRIYHEATDSNLPNEENRTYFATPEEAEAAGYRPAQV